MTDAGEVAADIGLEYVVHLLGHDLQAQRLQSVVRVAPRSKAVTAVEEIRFKRGHDNAPAVDWPDGKDHAPALRDIVDLLAKGLRAADEIGRSFLAGRALTIWRNALL